MAASGVLILFYFSCINRIFIWQSPQIQVLHVSHFAIIKEENTPFFKNLVLSLGKINVYWSSKIEVLQIAVNKDQWHPCSK